MQIGTTMWEFFDNRVMLDIVKLALLVELLICFSGTTGVGAMQCYTCNHNENNSNYVLSQGTGGTASSKYCDYPINNKSMITTCFKPANTEPRYQCTEYIAKNATKNVRIIVRDCVPTNPKYTSDIHVLCDRPGTVQSVTLMGETYDAIAKCCDKDACNVDRLSFAEPTTPKPTEPSPAMSAFLSLSSACYAFVFLCLFLL
ncbi:uncharacterized protein LOC135484435 isoform X2 [Lineus longissimus]|uniref:uncharacterized protein LOC135484435 isoform X2 n=1 Tax=Lineus longissimus TaxID=88925 RepID=UPI002B4D4524